MRSPPLPRSGAPEDPPQRDHLYHAQESDGEEAEHRDGAGQETARLEVVELDEGSEDGGVYGITPTTVLMGVLASLGVYYLYTTFAEASSERPRRPSHSRRRHPGGDFV